MSSIQEGRQMKMIGELRTFIKKVLSDPALASQCMDIARRLKDEPDAESKIAAEISATTIVRIPENLSEADRLFLEIIFEVLDDEAALY
ncbi:MAG: hypothetical protein CSA52_01800 [Gammaproteobacteria bacterium]|nr:MAG: hypothetical protein CSB48_01505 [Pseudomonadota bacterium]PIE38595.1 MAG: hypothetical protein CSA52_01800 [Gammaproteobacteria bacterium]